MNDVEGQHDALTGLQSPTQYGRPNWKVIFQNISEEHSGADVGVFCCGPQILANELLKRSNETTGLSLAKGGGGEGCSFYFHQEHF